jgi:nitrous oxidase accessory protein NosD
MPTPDQFGVGVAVGSVNGVSNVTVRDVVVSELDVGVRLTNAEASTVRGVTAIDNANGIVVSNAREVTVEQVNTATSEEDGLVVRESSSVVVTETASNENGFAGIVVANSTAVAIADTTVRSNVGDGIFAHSATELSIREVTAVDNAVGILLFDSPQTVVSDSVVGRSGFVGVGVVHSDGVAIEDSAVVNTTGTLTLMDEPAGLWLVESDDAAIENTLVSENERWAVYATDGSENVTVANSGPETMRLSFVGDDVAVDARDTRAERCEATSAAIETERDRAKPPAIVVAYTDADARIYFVGVHCGDE